MLDNGKTESCPAAGASFVRPVEALKDSDLVVSFQADAVIRHLQEQGLSRSTFFLAGNSHIRLYPIRNVYMSIFAVIRDRVVNEIKQYLLNAIPVSFDL